MSALFLWVLSAAWGGPLRVDVRLSTKGDDVSFDKHELDVPTGRRLAITFVNGASAESAIFHNVVVLMPGPDTETQIFQKLYEVNFDLTKMVGDPRILALGKTLAPGDTETLTLQFPGPGTYPYVCLMPGHGDMMGMRGTIVVH